MISATNIQHDINELLQNMNTEASRNLTDDKTIIKKIKDSGNRREFESGAVRDIAQGKGRCDLLPLSAISKLNITSNKNINNIFDYLNAFIWEGDVHNLVRVIDNFCIATDSTVAGWMLEVSKQYEAGAEKYGERNWEKGIPLHSFIDSAIRHLLKYIDNWDDEPHDRAFIWNILGAIWTVDNKPELIDLPFISGEYEA